MTIARIAPWAALAVLSLAFSVPVQAQSPWPAPAAGPGQFPSANPPAAGPGQFPPANAPAPAAAGPGQFPAAGSPQMLPQQPGSVPPPSQWGNAGGGAAPAGQHPAWGGSRPGGPPQLPCADEVAPLRDEAQSKGMALKNTIDTKKGDRDAICKAFRTFSAAEGKMVKFVQDNVARCGFPAEVAKGAKANHGKTLAMTNRVCNAAAGPGAPPPPSLSDALGTSRIPDSSNIKTGKGGTFDTLSGSTLSR